MAKKLTTQQWLNRAIDSGRETVKSAAAKLGRSESTLRDILSGRRPGEKLFESVRDLAKGKRTITPPPPVKAPKPRILPPPVEPPSFKSALAKAELQLDKLFEQGSTDKVTVHVTDKKTGMTTVLGRHGGIKLGTIQNAPSLEDFLSAGLQGGNYGDIDWDDVASIEFEEYY